jgi:flagellar basal body-associated protein FliL
MKKFLIPLTALLLMGGVGAFYSLTGGGDRETPVDSAPGQASSDETHVYVELAPITATIFRDQQPAGTFTAAVTLEIADANDRTTILQSRRQLHDAMFRELHAMFEREEYSGRKVNVDAVKRRMLVVSRREFGEGVVVDVFVITLMRTGA